MSDLVIFVIEASKDIPEYARIFFHVFEACASGEPERMLKKFVLCN